MSPAMQRAAALSASVVSAAANGAATAASRAAPSIQSFYETTRASAKDIARSARSTGPPPNPRRGGNGGDANGEQLASQALAETGAGVVSLAAQAVRGATDVAALAYDGFVEGAMASSPSAEGGIVGAVRSAVAGSVAAGDASGPVLGSYGDSSAAASAAAPSRAARRSRRAGAPAPAPALSASVV